MKIIENFDNISENLAVGAYVVNILKVTDNPEKEYLEIICDIAEGKDANHFKNLGNEGHKTYRFYRANSIYYFKRFITSIEKSNPGYKWNWDERTLVGKKAVAVFGEEEYVDNDFTVKTSLKVFEWRSIQALRENRIELPAKKLLSAEKRELAERERAAHANPTGAPTSATPTSKPMINDDDLPF